MATLALALPFAALSGVQLGLASARGNANLLLMGVLDGLFTLAILFVGPLV